MGRVGVGCAAGSPPGSQVDDEVTLPGLRYPVGKPRSSTSRRYSRRRYRCPVGPAIAERWVARALGPVGVGWHGPRFGRWVGRWVCFLGVGCSRAATTRSPDGILCRASLDVVLKHPSSWRRDPWGFTFYHFLGVGLGVGCWALGRALGVGRWVRGRVAPGSSA